MTLHVACLPFPSHQGTQAAIDAMLSASSASGESTHLLTYAHGAYARVTAYEHHRIPDFPRVRSLRSGPSWGKVALDARCVASIRDLARHLRPPAIVAHHIEAAAASVAADVAPVYYFAHTSLSHELPVYFPRLPRRVVSAMGSAVERWVCARAAGVAAVAPSLAAMLPNARYIPVPWGRAAERMPRREARAALDLPADARICLYAGNLDCYQGWERLFDALPRLRRVVPRARLLVATVSNLTPAQRAARIRGIEGAVDFRPLSSELARMRVHAAADVAWVPRRSAGGLPVKMLDAFSRELPVVAVARATAGLPVSDTCAVVPNDDPNALAAETARLLDDPRATAVQSGRASEYLMAHHSATAHVDAMRSWLGAPEPSRPKARQRAQHPRVGPELQAR
jgi:glycosyltransferase involved in cell wall biosynthesis